MNVRKFGPGRPPPRRPNGPDRIPRIQLDDDGTLDDFYANNVESVHFEALGEAQWYAVIRLRSGEEWLLNFGAVNHQAKGYARAEQD
jgi:hypothetical protein